MRKTILGSALCYSLLLLALTALLLTRGSFWALAGLCLLLLLLLTSWAVNFYVRRHLQADILTPASETHGSQLPGAYPQFGAAARNALRLPDLYPQ